MYCPQSWQFITFMFQHRCVSIVRDKQVTYDDYDGGGSVNQLRNDVFNAKFQLAYDFLRHALFFANQAILRNMSSLYIPGTSCSYYTKHWFDDTQWYFHYDTNCTMSSVINHKLIMTSPVYATHECLGEHFDVTMEHVFLWNMNVMGSPSVRMGVMKITVIQSVIYQWTAIVYAAIVLYVHAQIFSISVKPVAAYPCQNCVIASAIAVTGVMKGIVRLVMF